MTSDFEPVREQVAAAGVGAVGLQPAAAAPRSHAGRMGLVIISGLASTVLALVAVYLLEHFAETNVMGWYADNVLPVGAILVGLVASLGYGLAAYWLGLKIRRVLLLGIVLLQIGGYFAAKYTEYAMRGPLVNVATNQPITSFTEYFRLTTENMAWKDDKGNLGQPLGGWGYALRFGEIAGFVLGTLIVPGILLKKPYCDACEQYMQNKSLALLPASNTRPRHLFGKKATKMSAQEVMEMGMTDVVELVSLGTAGDAPGFATKLDALAPQRSQANKLSKKINVRLISCTRCQAGRLDIQLTETKGRQVTNKKMGGSEVNPQFVRELRERRIA